MARFIKRSLTSTVALAIGLLISLLGQNLGAQAAGSPSDDYIVTFKNSANTVVESRDYENANGVVRNTFTYGGKFKGMTVKANSFELARLRMDPNVLSIEKDAVVTAQATQANPTWGIDRIDQVDLPLNNSYNYATSGAGVKVYVVDTGVLATHVELAGRVDPGFTAIADGLGTSDGNGHGTHVSGTIAGTTYGIAKSARIVPVRVLDRTGSGTTAGVIAGLDWVNSQISQGVTRAVVNMSLGGGVSAAMNTAVANLVNKGATVVVAAGNSTADACSSSPSSEPSAITVAATDNTDTFASYSNFGRCVDIMAPGTGITSSWIGSNTAINTISGTSMATPHVVGAVALLMESSYKTPAQIDSALKAVAVPKTITAVPAATPDNFLYTGPIAPLITPGSQTIAANVGVNLSTQTLTTKNFSSSVTYAVASGTLPAGLTLNPVTGVVSGVPTAAQASTKVVIRGSGSIGVQTATADLIFSVGRAPGVPTSVVAVTPALPTTRTATLTWTPGSANGATSVTQTVRVYSGNSINPSAVLVITNSNASTSTATITGLTSRSTYRFTISMTSEFGTSPISAFSNTITAR
jgi:subtilisin family serine protease